VIAHVRCNDDALGDFFGRAAATAAAAANVD